MLPFLIFFSMPRITSYFCVAKDIGIGNNNAKGKKRREHEKNTTKKLLSQENGSAKLY